MNTTDTVIEVNYSSAVSQIATENYILIFGEEEIPLESVTEIDSTTHQLNLATPLEAGEYQLTIKGVTDIAGNLVEETAALEFTVIGAPVSISPRSGSEMVSLTREVMVNFGKKVDPTTVNENTFTIIAQGEAVPGKIVVSSTQKFATFFPDSPLPASTSVRVTLDGNQVMGLDGVALDADGDGNPGGILTADFSTLSITLIQGTELWGYVYDSFNRDENGENVPIIGATVRVDALPEAVAVTDENGYFRLENLPAPLVAVHIDGSTATNAPEGFVYPTVGKIFHTVPGVEIQVNHHGEVFDIFLPPMAETDTQQLSPTEDTNVGLGAAGIQQLQQLLPEVEADTWELLQVTFPAGSAQDEAGNVATRATIIPVNPERLPAPLPPHFNPKIVVSIQAEGATNFDVPAPVQFPNIDGLPPGSKCFLFSFDHDSGSWEVVGTGTVRPDGLAIVSDPGTGIVAPGWHFVNETTPTPPPPCPPRTPNTQRTEHPPIALDFITGEAATNFSTLTWTAPSSPSSNNCNRFSPSIKVVIEIDGLLRQFMKPIDGGVGLQDHEIELSADSGEIKKFGFQTKTYDELFGSGGFVNLRRDQLYGAQIKITVEKQQANGDRTVDVHTYYQYRWVDVIDAEKALNRTGNTAAFHRTLTDGFERTKKVDYRVPKRVSTTFQVPASPFDFGGGISDSGTAIWKFDPDTTQLWNATVEIEVNDPNSSRIVDVGEIVATGKGTEPTEIDLNLSGYKNELKRVLQSLLRLPGADGVFMTADDFFQYNFASGNTRTTSARFNTEFAGFLPGQTYTDAQLNNKLNTEANRLLTAVKADYQPVNDAAGVTGYKIGSFPSADITITWGDVFLGNSGIPVYGATERDWNTDFLRNHIAPSIPISDAAKQWALAEGLNLKASGNASVGVAININWNSTATFAQFIANTVNHEIAHTFGLKDAYYVTTGGIINTEPFDIMQAGSITDQDLTFALENQHLLRAALGIHGNQDKPLTDALDLYQKIFNQPSSPIGLRPQIPIDALQIPEIYVETGKRNFSYWPPRAFMEPTGADGVGGALTTLDLMVINVGGVTPLIIDSVALADGTQGFSVVNADTIDTSLGYQDRTTLKIQFDPTTVGSFTDTLIISSNANRNPIYEIQLNGEGIPPTPLAELSIDLSGRGNNLGGVAVDGGTANENRIATIANQGAEPLIIHEVRIVEGEEAFTLLDPLDSPVSLNYGESCRI